MEFEIIVVDNGSSDGTVKRIGNEFPGVRVLENAENVGFGRACNQGMRAASSDLILLLNSDTYVVDDAIPRAVNLINQRQEFGVLSCQLRSPDGSVQRTTRRSLSIHHGLLEDLWLYRLLPPRTWQKLMLAHHWDHSEELEVDCVMGAFMLLRRKVFVESGGFNEDFFMYGEDQEWCMRLRAGGTRILYSPEPVIFHIGGSSSSQTWTPKQLILRSVEGDVRAYSMINGPVWGLTYNVTRLLGCTVRTVVYGLDRWIHTGRRHLPYHRYATAFALSLIRLHAFRARNSKLAAPVERTRT